MRLRSVQSVGSSAIRAQSCTGPEHRKVRLFNSETYDQKARAFETDIDFLSFDYICSSNSSWGGLIQLILIRE